LGATELDTEFSRGLGLFESTTVVVGSMIGSGIFIVSADMARTIGSPGWLLVAWLLTGLLTIVGALSYGELAAMMPRAGGQYVYLREAFSPLWGFLYGWTLFLVIQTGTIAAVAVGFARYLGVMLPWIADDHYLVAPIAIGSAHRVAVDYAVGRHRDDRVSDPTSTRGLEDGRVIQNVFTTAKTRRSSPSSSSAWSSANAMAVSDNFGAFWSARPAVDVVPGLTALSAFGLFVAVLVSQAGSLFSAGLEQHLVLGEVKEPRRNIPSLAFGTTIVITLLLANVAYLVTLPFTSIQHAPADRVATATLDVFPGRHHDRPLAIVIHVGCTNGLVLAGARAYYAMARDGLFFARRER
jgi:APA family basic amino acid/polyamine antiporter